MDPVLVKQGAGPVILGMPHGGTEIPDTLSPRMNEKGLAVADTDWWIDQLYDGLLAEATVVRATFSRYVVDANRDPSGASLYPGQNTTSVCPLTTFDGDSIYRSGEEPDKGEIAERLAQFHTPYHDALAKEIERVRATHGVAVLYDCHSIRSEIPYLFDGRLPVFNIGSNDGKSCAPLVEKIVETACAGVAVDGYNFVLNGRFKGGWTTRRYGQPSDGVHAVQMELAQIAYMDETPPWTYRPEKAGRVRQCLSNILTALERAALDGQLSSNYEESGNV